MNVVFDFHVFFPIPKQRLSVSSSKCQERTIHLPTLYYSVLHCAEGPKTTQRVGFLLQSGGPARTRVFSPTDQPTASLQGLYSKKDQTSSARIGTAPKGRKAISPPVGANVQIPLQHRTFSLQVAGQAIESLLVKRCACPLDAHASRQHSNATLQVTVTYKVRHAVLGTGWCLWSGPAPRTFRTFSRFSRARCWRPGSDLCSVAYPRNMPCRWMDPASVWPATQG